MADLCQASYPFSKGEIKAHPASSADSVAVQLPPHTSTGYSDDLGQPFINILLFFQFALVVL